MKTEYAIVQCQGHAYVVNRFATEMLDILAEGGVWHSVDFTDFAPTIGKYTSKRHFTHLQLRVLKFIGLVEQDQREYQYTGKEYQLFACEPITPYNGKCVNFHSHPIAVSTYHGEVFTCDQEAGLFLEALRDDPLRLTKYVEQTARQIDKYKIIRILSKFEELGLVERVGRGHWVRGAKEYHTSDVTPVITTSDFCNTLRRPSLINGTYRIDRPNHLRLVA